ncbi:MAG: UvrD-helicase domain-containing protein [Bacteroidaceae bacterium]|nr:UvrD-helicase domain-containing protein [Bacteroidaceae bacterium]
MQDLHKYLDKAQYEAVTTCDGPTLILAGAGSGKTRVLTYKIAYLLSKGVMPWQVLALTFTNKAAKEMNNRIAQLVDGDVTKHLWSGTFHSLFGRILRIESQFIGYTSNFTIYDQSDAQSLINTIIKELNLDSKVYKPAMVLSRISAAKNRLILPEHYQADGELRKADQLAGVPAVAEIYQCYKNRCRLANAMDFDDLLVETYRLFREHEEVRQRYLQRFTYILVDEYQDTNYVQHQIISQLTTPESCISVVGDDAQSIYGFRGARIENILNFTRQYPSAKVIKLECNYRSTGMIVGAANAIIANNKHQIPKQVFSNKGDGHVLQLFETASDKDESYRVAGEISRLNRQGISHNEMVVLYRTNAQSRSFEEAFRLKGIPYRIYGGLSFYQRKEVKDLLAYLRLIANPRDEEAFKRVVNYPRRGIGDTTVGKLKMASAEHSVPILQAAANPNVCNLTLSATTAKRLYEFAQRIMEYANLAQQGVSVCDLAKQILFAEGIHKDLEGEGSEGAAKIQNLEELIGAMAEMETEVREEQGIETLTLTEYLSRVSLLTDADQTDDGAPRVTLMTVHAAKGLEFEVVFVTGMEEGLFPAESSRFSNKELEEERRLFYVAVTRAKSYCILSYAKTRFKWGQFQYCSESSFLRDVPRKYFSASSDEHQVPFASRTSASSQQRVTTSSPSPSVVRPSSLVRLNSATVATTAASRPSTPLNISDIVQHERFGMGTVRELDGSGNGAKAVVDFQGVGQKTLLLSFAKLKVITRNE